VPGSDATLLDIKIKFAVVPHTHDNAKPAPPSPPKDNSARLASGLISSFRSHFKAKMTPA
jgi:hypothetical protein